MLWMCWLGCQSPTPRPLPAEPLSLDWPNLPVLGAPFDADRELESAYGPRESGGDQEFHLGLDWRGSRNESVFAGLSGIVKKVRVPTTSSQSLFVILEHEVPAFTWQGQTHTKMYTSYHHLDTVDVIEDEPIMAGQRIGGMGDSGEADSVHLHMELRLGTHCSLEYQLDNPDSSCALGFSPHVDPQLALALPGAPLELQRDGEVLRVTAPRPDAGIRRIETSLGTVDFSEWIGIENRSNSTRDDPDLGWATWSATSTEEARILELHCEGEPLDVTVWDAHGRPTALP